MKNMVTTVIVSILLCACSRVAEQEPIDVVQAKPPIFDLPYLMRDLDNGLRVIVVPTDYPDIVSMHIPVQTGSRNEVEPGKSGFAHFFEHMMIRGTQKYPADVYTNIMKKAGAMRNASTYNDYTNYYTIFTKDDLETMIEVEADRFQNQDYTEEAFRTEALAVKGEYLNNYSNPLQVAYKRLRKLGFTTHPYRHTTMGITADVDAMPEQFEYSKVFFDRWYRPEKTSVIIVGDVDPEAAFDLVKKYWGNWKRGDYIANIPPDPPFEGPVYDHIQWDGPTQPYLLIAYRGPAFDARSKDMPALNLLASTYFSDSSDLYKMLVLENQWVDFLAIDFENNVDPNMLMVYMRLTDARYSVEVMTAIRDTIVRARTELVKFATLQQTKSHIRYAFASELESARSIASVLAGYVHFERTPETINDVYRSFDDLTPEDLRDVANRYFIDSTRVTVSLSNDESISGLGSSYSLDESVVAVSAVLSDVGGAQSVASTDEPVRRLEPAQADVVPVSVIAQPSASSPLVNVSIVVHAGAALDPPGKKGLAAMTAAMLSDGASRWNAIEDIRTSMYSMAAGFDAQVDKEMTRFSGQVHRDNLDNWYRLIRGQLLAPAWSEQDFERLRTQQINAIGSGLVGDNDEELAKEILYSSIYGEAHPYGNPNIGAITDLESMTIADLQNFYNEHYTINNLTVGLSGGYPDSLPETISDDLQSRPTGQRAAPEIPPVQDMSRAHATIVEKETTGVAVSLGFPIELARGDDDWIALWLVRSFLGEHRSTSGHLFQRLRSERGLNYGDYAYIEYFPRGMFQLQPDTNLARQQQIFQLWLRPLRSINDAHFATRAAVWELDRLVAQGMTETDFEASRTFLAKSVSLLTDGQTRQLGYAIDSQYYNIDEFADYVRAGLAELTLDDVNRVIRENLEARKMHFVFVTNNAEQLARQLTTDAISPMTYDSEKPASLLDEDRQIESFPLGPMDVAIVKAADVFD